MKKSQGNKKTVRQTRKRAETVVCFAYGSNMLSTRIQARVPSARPLRLGYINGYRLIFHKRSSDGSAKCDAEVSGNVDDRVYGVLFELKSTEKALLDGAEGLHEGYEEKKVDVMTRSGPRPAVMYFATSKDASLKAYHWYKALVVAGAVEHRLPFSYVEWLRTTESIQDQDPERRANAERLLTSPPSMWPGRGAGQRRAK